MWSLISGLLVLLVMVIGACLGYVSTILERKKEHQEYMVNVAREDQNDVTVNTSAETLSVNGSESISRVTIVVSPRDLERIMKESQGPPAYEDLSLPPPYEVAVAYE